MPDEHSLSIANLSYVIPCISLAQELPVTADKQLWRENLGNVNAFTCVNQGSVYALIAVSVQGEPEQLAEISFAFLGDF